MKKVMVTAVALTMLAGGYLSFTAVDADNSQAVAGKSTYEAQVYVAGMGGHFADAEVVIDPNNSEQPIQVNNLGMVRIGNKNTHPTHDARIDANDRNIMYWSTYRPDPDGNIHVGKTDLTNNQVILDKPLVADERVYWDGANYCGSGQSEDYYIPVYMGNEGYIDVFAKDDLAHKQRVFFDDLGYKAGEYTFAHGTNSPDMKHFLLSLNLTPDGHTQFNTGSTKLYLLDMQALEQGEIKKVAEGTLTGKPRDAAGGTITFRQYYTEDGKYIFQSGADRGYIVDAKTLEVVQVATPLPGEAHDFMPTPDGKYGIFSLREQVFSAADEGNVADGTLGLYDVKAKAMVGETTSVCLACHQQMGLHGGAILCGLDANFK